MPEHTITADCVWRNWLGGTVDGLPFAAKICDVNSLDGIDNGRIYSFAQVEKTAPAPDLETLKSRFSGLPGLTLTVKGEQTGAPNVWFTDDVKKYAEEIKAAGGVWSKKKSAYWIKPSPAPESSAPTAAPAPKTATWTIHPGKPAPQPWKKHSFYTIRRDKGDDREKPHMVDGYTDGLFNYYVSGGKSKRWHAIYPAYGLSVAYDSSRKAAQARALELIETVHKMEAKKDARLQAYADMMKTAQDGGNLSLF